MRVWSLPGVVCLLPALAYGQEEGDADVNGRGQIKAAQHVPRAVGKKKQVIVENRIQQVVGAHEALVAAVNQLDQVERKGTGKEERPAHLPEEDPQ